MRAVFPVAVAVNLEDAAAMMALQPIDGFPLHEMQMAVPPLLATGIRAEPPLFPARNLLHRFAAAFATQANIRSLRLDCLRLCCIHPAAKRLHGVLGQADVLRDFLVALALSAKVFDLLLLLFCHAAVPLLLLKGQKVEFLADVFIKSPL